MTKTSIVFVATLSLAAFGCKKKGGDCTKAIANSMEVSKASMAGVDKTMLAKMQTLAVKNCQDDKWSAELVTCMTDAKTEPEAQGCYSKLTPDQQAKMNKAAMELASPAAGSGSAAAGSAAADSADATNSAGSAGSAGSGGAAAGGSDTAGGSAK
jgi:hypothetical protein